MKQATHSEAEKTVNKDIQRLVDSIARVHIQSEMERVFSRTDEVETDIILFDTDKPASDSTGLPPVKAMVKQKSKSQEQGGEKAVSQATTETDKTVQETDRSHEAEITDEVVEDKPSFWDSLKHQLLRILLIPALFIALWLLYKLIKLVKNGK